MIIHPHQISEMAVCGDCRDVVGPFYRLHGSLAGDGPFDQRGTCPRHEPHKYDTAWRHFDFNRAVDLCYCCGTVPLTSGSRWSVWFCDDCKHQVGLLNGRHGRCIVPIGRHSVHHGCLLRGDQADDPVAVQMFADASKAAHVVINALADWYHIAVARNLEMFGAGTGTVSPVEEYCRAVTTRVDPMARFREMCDYLDRRGRGVGA